MDLLEQLKRDEGVRYKPYVDTVGKSTIGVGRNLTDVGISEAEAEFLLANDIARVTDQLAPYAWYQGLDEVRKAAIENMCFNIGLASLLHFPTLLHCLTVRDWPGAAAAMADSRWAVQVGDRAKRLQQQILTGEWQ